MAHGVPIWHFADGNQTPRLVIVSIVFMVITTLVFIFRQAWRWAHQQRGWDDIMAACAYAVLLIQTIFGGVAAHYGFGKHMADIRPTFSLALEYFYLYQICYKILGGFTKLTFCFLYLRIFDQVHFRRIVWITIAIVTLGSAAFALGTVVQCIPVNRAWDRTVPGSCINNTGFWYSHAAFNIFMDIVVYVLPIPMIGRLKLARGQKTGLISIFGLGAFVIAAATVRMVMLRGSAKTHDPTWGSVEALIWTEIEASVSVICCCLPALRVPAVNIFRRLCGKRGRRSCSPEEWKRDRREGAWDGGLQRSRADIRVHKPIASYQANAKSLHNSTGSSGSRHNDAAWYNKMYRSSLITNTTRDREKSATTNNLMGGSKSSSTESFARIPEAESPPIPDLPPAVMELGAIYKTTDINVHIDKQQSAGGGTPPVLPSARSSRVDEQ